LRCALLVALLAATATAPLAARTAPVRVLVYAPVADAARTTMPPALWSRMVGDYVSAHVVTFDGDAPPVVADCRKAGADFMVTAPFDLRPRLPGMANSSGRVSAVTHLEFTNCVTGRVVYNQRVDLESDPGSQPEGDLDSVPEISWAKTVPATLARYPLYFPRVSRVIQVTPPLVTIDLRNEVKPNDVLVVYAGADRAVKKPIYLVVTQVNGKYVQALYSTVNGGPAPAVGDYVEPAPTDAVNVADPDAPPSPAPKKH
jgi:hypothetical protein